MSSAKGLALLNSDNVLGIAPLRPSASPSLRRLSMAACGGKETPATQRWCLSPTFFAADPRGLMETTDGGSHERGNQAGGHGKIEFPQGTSLKTFPCGGITVHCKDTDCVLAFSGTKF